MPLDRNERLAPLPDWFMEKLQAGLGSSMLTTYPILDELYTDLGAHFGLARESMLATPGSDAAFRSAFHAFVAPGDGVVMLDPSYAMYAVYAEMFGARATKVPIGRDLSFDLDALLGAIGTDVKLVLLASPNQPTGTVIGDDAMRAVLERAGEVGALVLVDEAYHPFSGTTVLGWAPDEPNLLVTRTFSKAAGLAGLRAGLAAGTTEVVGALAKVRSVFDISSFTALAVRTVLANPAVMDDYVAQVDTGRELLAERARALGLDPVQSTTNFMLIRVANRTPPERLVPALRDRGYIVRGPFAAACLADCIRVTIGPPELMERFAAALSDAIDSI